MKDLGYFEKTCKNCNKIFKVRNIRKDKAKFCSHKCYWIFLKLSNPQREHLYKLGLRQRGENSPVWKGGTRSGGYEYLRIHSPNHPNKDTQGYVAKHRLVVEENIGRNLKDKELIHHLDGDKSNNDITNLLLCKNSSEHGNIHYAMEQFVYELIKNKKVFYCKEDKKFKWLNGTTPFCKPIYL